MQKILIIGKKELISVFYFAGFETLFVENADDALKKFKMLKPNIQEYSNIFIIENFYIALQDEINKISNLPTPAITILPDVVENKNIAKNIIKKAVEKATGSDILSKK